MPSSQDKVFLRMTCPSSFGPFDRTHYGAVIAIVMEVMYAYYFFTDELRVLAAASPLYAICMAITAYDPHAFQLTALKLKTTAETIGNRMHWGGSSRAPCERRRF